MPGSVYKCHEMFNLRIMCMRCNSESLTMTPYQYAKEEVLMKLIRSQWKKILIA